jgi:hypothetical protein
MNACVRQEKEPMPQPRLYPSAAHRQAAYRQRQRERTVALQRDTWEALTQRLGALEMAIWAAAARGEPIALHCRSASQQDMLDRLIGHFQQDGEHEPS